MRRVRYLNLTLVLVLLSTTFACAQPAQPTAAPTSPPATAAPPAAAPTTGTAPTVAPLPSPTPPPATAAAKPGESLKPAGAATDATPTPAARPMTFDKSTIDTLGVAQTSGGWIGGVSHVVINVERNNNRELRVGFYEEEVGGTGPMWRSAGWMAVIMSSFLLGTDPVEYRYSYDVGGLIDGPSAGALMTVGTMSALLGHKVKADATMTGTINPDGTIGPVGGIPHKIDGAAAKGKTLVLVPAGSRMSMDMNAKQMVDVVDRGRRQNVTVKEVSDIYEAYELLTGKALPKPAGLKDSRPELPPASFDRAKGKAKEWYTRYWQLKTQYDALPKAVKGDFTESMIAQANAAGDKADKYYQQGMASAAYSKALEATQNASVGYQTSKVIEAFATGGMDAAITYLKSMQTVNLKADALLDRLQTQKPLTLSDAIALGDAYGSVNLAMGLSSLAGDVLQTKVTSNEEALTVLAMATLIYALADHSVELSKDAIDLGWGSGTAPAPSEETIASLAELFRRAADANLSYFDSVVLGEIAQGAGVHVDVVKQKFAYQDVTYLFAKSSMLNLNALRQRAGPGQAGMYAVFGGSLNSYALSSLLVAKYYSLGVQRDKDGNVTGVENERAMINMLDFAEKRSRETIALAKSLNAEPVHPVLYYEEGKARREGDTDQKFSALTSYWQSVMQAMAIAILSGKANVLAPK